MWDSGKSFWQQGQVSQPPLLCNSCHKNFLQNIVSVSDKLWKTVSDKLWKTVVNYGKQLTE